jgi:thiol-disulfide isomerase/thioredoxin
MERISVSLIVVLILLFSVSCAGDSNPSGDQKPEVAKDQRGFTKISPINTDAATNAQAKTKTETNAQIAGKEQTSKPVATLHSDVQIGNEIGHDLGDFVNYDPDSTLRHLSDLRGKMVMVMLWNSLCHHCVVDNEKHRKTYEKYHDKTFIHGDGFDIYAIALDKERSTWIDALNEKKYPWTSNVYVIDSWKDRDIRFFGVRNLPGTFLIDRDGIVVNKLFTPDQLEQHLEDYLVN